MTIRFERKNAVALVTIDRPERHNAITPEMDLEFRRLWPEIAADDRIRAVVLTGAGARAFCAGADIPTLLPDLRERIRSGTDLRDFCGMTWEPPVDKPIIAAVNGVAFGGGCEIALACDLRIASDTAQFALPEVRWGIIAAGGGATRLARHLPPAVAGEILLAGRTLTADRALALGLVSELAAPDQLMARAMTLAEEIAARAPLAVAATLSLLRGAQSLIPLESLMTERRLLGRLLDTDDAREGIAAFSEKRPAVFTGH